MPKKYAKHGRNKRKPNARQQKFVKALAEGKALTQEAKEANYSSKNPGPVYPKSTISLRTPRPLSDLVEHRFRGS
jgi:hypothetical protein